MHSSVLTPREHAGGNACAPFIFNFFYSFLHEWSARVVCTVPELLLPLRCCSPLLAVAAFFHFSEYDNKVRTGRSARSLSRRDPRESNTGPHNDLAGIAVYFACVCLWFFRACSLTLFFSSSLTFSENHETTTMVFSRFLGCSMLLCTDWNSPGYSFR